MHQPTVSIIVPVYNAEKGIRRCVDSILGQEFTDFELLLVDDGSTDGSPAILDAYAAADPRVTVIHKPNSGVSATRNLALGKAKGTYIQFLDADDWITEDATKLLVRSALENNADMVIADFYRVVGNDVARKGQISGDATRLSRQEYADLMMKDPADFYYGVIWNKLYRASIIRDHDVRMDETLNWCEDFIFNLEYVLHVRTVAVLRSPIYYYVKTEGSLVSRTDLTDVVRMKRTVLGYYRDFYRSVFDEDEYKRRRTDIYRYLVSFATDDSAIGGMPGTTKLGRERVPGYVPAGAQPNPFLGVYWAQRVLDRYLDRVAEQNDLTLKQARIMAYLRYCPGVVDMAALADFLQQTRATTMVDLQRLSMSGLIDLQWHDGGFEASFCVPRGEQVAAGIDHVAADFESMLAPTLGVADGGAAGGGAATGGAMGGGAAGAERGGADGHSVDTTDGAQYSSAQDARSTAERLLNGGFTALAQALNKSSTMQLAKKTAAAKEAANLKAQKTTHPDDVHSDDSHSRGLRSDDWRSDDSHPLDSHPNDSDSHDKSRKEADKESHKASHTAPRRERHVHKSLKQAAEEALEEACEEAAREVGEQREMNEQ